MRVSTHTSDTNSLGYEHSPTNTLSQTLAHERRRKRAHTLLTPAQVSTVPSSSPPPPNHAHTPTPLTSSNANDYHVLDRKAERCLVLECTQRERQVPSHRHLQRQKPRVVKHVSRYRRSTSWCTRTYILIVLIQTSLSHAVNSNANSP